MVLEVAFVIWTRRPEALSAGRGPFSVHDCADRTVAGCAFST